MTQAQQVDDEQQEIARLQSKLRETQYALEALCREKQGLEQDLQTLQTSAGDLSQTLRQYQETWGQLEQEKDQGQKAYEGESRRISKVLGQRREAKRLHLREFGLLQAENERLANQLRQLRDEVTELENERIRDGLAPIRYESE